MTNARNNSQGNPNLLSLNGGPLVAATAVATSSASYFYAGCDVNNELL